MYIEEEAWKIRHSNTDWVKASVNRTLLSMRKDFVIKVCKSFRSLLERVIADNGGHIEYFDVYRYV